MPEDEVVLTHQGEFRGVGRALAPGRPVVGNLANNHARDAGTEGFERTREHLEAEGIFMRIDPAIEPEAYRGPS